MIYSKRGLSPDAFKGQTPAVIGHQLPEVVPALATRKLDTVGAL